LAKKTSSKSSTKVSLRGSASRQKTESMEDLLSKYGGRTPLVNLEKSQMVEGEVVDILPDKVIIDIGGKSEGVVAEKAFKEARNFIATLKVGDKVKAKVLVPETIDGIAILSLRESARDQVWKKIEESDKTEKPIKVKGISLKSSGLMIDYKGLAGFIPNSQLGKKAIKNPQALIGESFEAIVIESDRNERRIVLSELLVSDADLVKKQKKAMDKVSVGDIFEGEVTTLADFGCFVRLKVTVAGKEKVDLEGLVHVSELSWEKVGKPDDIVSEGDKVKIKVINKQDGKLALSMKQAESDPWETAANKYKKDEKFEGIVSKMTDFGLFVRLEPGIEGLVHVTKIPPGKVYEVGDDINVYVEDMDNKERKISLGLVLTAKPLGYR
jgi:small subunit ribosomal protein S1